MRPIFEFCRSCSDKNQYRPPCVNELNRYALLLHPLSKIGQSCPMRAPWSKIKPWAMQPAGAGALPPEAKAALQEIQAACRTATTPEQAGIFQANQKDSYGHAMDVFYSSKPPLKQGNPWVLLRALDAEGMKKHKQWFEAQGLNQAASAGQQRLMDEVRRRRMEESEARRAEAERRAKAAREFVRYKDVTEEMFEQLERAYAKGGTLGQVWRESSLYFGGATLTWNDFQRGCRNVEEAFRIAVSEHLASDLRKQLVPEDLIAAAVDLAKTVAIVAGLAGGTIALGAVVGGALAGWAGGQTGAAVMTLLVTQLAAAAGLAGVVVQAKEESGRLAAAVKDAWAGNTRAAAIVISAVFAVLIAALVWESLSRGAGKFARLRRGGKAVRTIPLADEARNIAKTLPPLDLDEVRRLHRKYLEEAEAGYQALLAARTKDEMRRALDRWSAASDEARLLRKFIPETVGHIQVVRAAGKLAEHHIREMKSRRASLKTYLMSRYGLSDAEYNVVFRQIDQLPNSLDFSTHDIAGPWAKVKAFVADRLKRKELSAMRMLEQEAKKRGKQRVEDFSPEEAAEIWLECDEVRLNQLLRGAGIDIARVYHQSDAGHHQPQNAADWLEFGLDVCAAWVQGRSYKDAKQLATLDPANFLDEFSGPDRLRASAWLKIGRAILQDLQEVMGESWVQYPQKHLPHDIRL